MSKRRSLTVIGSAVVVAAITIALIVGFGVSSSGTMSTRQQLARALAMKADLPGVLENGREGKREGLYGPAQELYGDEAYPATNVAFAQQQNALKAGNKIKAKGVKSLKPWEEIGPDTLNVSAFGTQTGGPPTQWSGRVTALAVGKKCNEEECSIYLGAAGGGIWRTNNALSKHPSWKQISDGQMDSNAIGSILVDPTDPKQKTIYVGTGEPNGSQDSEAGVGLYKSTDGGNHWTLVSGSVPYTKDRSIGAIAVDPSNSQHLLIGTDVARHSLSAESGGRFTPPGAPTIGLYESNNGGATWTLAFNRPQDPVDPTSLNGSDFFRGGVTKIEFDPSDPTTWYLSMFGYGLFRHTAVNGYENIFADTFSPFDALSIRFEFDAVKVPLTGKTRIYLGAGWNDNGTDPGHGASRLYRVDDASAPAAALTTGGTNGGWQDLSSSNDTDPGFASYDFCEGQCSYDMFVSSPPGRPDSVVIGGAMHYGELPPYFGADISNGRAVQLSNDKGVHFTDMTGDATARPGGLIFNFEDMHPDQHVVVFDPANLDIMFAGSDGGIIRTSGDFTDNSADCSTRGLSGQDLANCQAWLSRIPTRLTTINAGLNTLQFQRVSVDPSDPLHDVLGGTQDNGTLAYTGSTTWFLGMTGDGGDSGIDVNGINRFHTYTSAQVDENFHGNAPESWDWIGDPLLFAPEARAFYAPLLQDPLTSGQIFAGLTHVWRTQDSGGNQTFLDNHCNTTGYFGTSDQLFTGNCGDWVKLGTPTLTGSTFGADKGGQYVVALTRANDPSTLWAATRRGRLFISMNANASLESSVAFKRIDTLAQPTRFVSGISVDPTNPFHAIVTYSSYNAYAIAAGTATGHIFDVVVDPLSCGATTCSATFTPLDYDIGDQPILDVVYDQPTGDIYVATDFGVDRLPSGQASWIPAADGLPPVAVYGLTRAGGKKGTDRVIYASTHGRGAYRIDLPKAK